MNRTPFFAFSTGVPGVSPAWRSRVVVPIAYRTSPMATKTATILRTSDTRSASGPPTWSSAMPTMAATATTTAMMRVDPDRVTAIHPAASTTTNSASWASTRGTSPAIAVIVATATPTTRTTAAAAAIRRVFIVDPFSRSRRSPRR